TENERILKDLGAGVHKRLPTARPAIAQGGDHEQDAALKVLSDRCADRVAGARRESAGPGPRRRSRSPLGWYVGDGAGVTSAGSGRPLTFSGNPDITIPPGAIALSDAVRFDAPALSDLAIDLYLPGDTSATTSPLTRHTGALQTNYVSPAGDFTGAVAFPIES